MKRKLLRSIPLLSGALLLADCGKNESVEETQIVSECNGLVCSIAIEDVQLRRYTNVLGATKDRVVKREALTGPEDKITWELNNGDLATNNQLMNKGLMPCIGEVCTLNSNPTGWVYDSEGPQDINVHGTIVKPDGTRLEIDKNAVVTPNIGEPIITVKKNSDLDYTFTADMSDTGIPENATLTWYVNDNEIGSGETVNYTFDSASTEYTIKLVVTAETINDITVEQKITSGMLAPEIDTNSIVINGKNVSISVDNSQSGLPAGTTYTWSVEGTSVTAQGLSTSFDLPEYGKEYTIKLIATPPQGSSFEASTQVTSKYGTPTIDIQNLSGLQYKFSINTDATGIPSNAVYIVKVDGTEIARGSTSELIYNFNTPGNHNVELDIQVAGTTVATISKNIDTTGQEAVEPTFALNSVNNNPLHYKATVDTTGTIIESSWDRKWLINDEVVSTTDTLDHIFEQTSTQYTIEYIASSPDGKYTRSAKKQFTTAPAKAPSSISEAKVQGNLEYELSVDLANTGITDNWSLEWSSNPNATFTAANQTTTNVSFDDYDTSYNATFTATPPLGSAANPVSITKAITTGVEDQPDLTQSSTSPLDYTISADLNNTGIDNTWNITWKVNDQVVSNDLNTLNYTFPLTGTSYTVSYTATKNGQTRQASIDITTANATAPENISQAKAQGNLEYDLSVALTNTGITDDWTIAWSSTPNANFSPADQTNTRASFDNYDTNYNVTFTATPPAGSGLSPVSLNQTITTGVEDQPDLTQSSTSPIDYTITADLSNTGIDNTWNIVWKVNDQVVPGNLTTLNYTFPLTSTSYTVSYTATKADQTRQANINITTPAARAPANITEGTQISVREYELAVDLTNTGITDDWSLQWSSDPDATFTAADQTSTNVSFDDYNTNYNVTFTATPPQGSTANPVSITKAITTGAAIQPTISHQTTANPLQLNYTANISQTDIDGSWTQKWYIDNIEVPGATGDTATLDFALAGTNYTVKYVATKDDQTRQVTSSVTTPNAKAPENISQAKAQGNLEYDLSVDLTNTGITNDWTIAWSSTPNANFSPADQTNTRASFDNYDTNYNVTFTATPPAGSGLSPVSLNQTITTGVEDQPDLTQSSTSPIDYTITADLNNTGIDNSWNITWKVNDQVVPGNLTTLNYTFPLTSTSYNVSYTATKGDQTRQANINITTATARAPANITEGTQTSPRDYELSVDLANTGITDDWSLQWSSDPNATFTAADQTSTNVSFDDYNTNYNVTFTATPPQGSTANPVSITKVITTDFKSQPGLTQSSTSPLDYTISADLNNTGIDNTWNIVWKVNDQVVSNNLNTLNYTFPLTGTSYNVKYIATKNGQTRQASIDITTPQAKAPENISQAIAQGNLEYDLSVDLTNTGITNDWTIAWSSTPNANFSPADQTNTRASFDNYDTNYNVTFTATPPAGSGLSPVSLNQTITTGVEDQPDLTQSSTSPIDYTITADLSNTGIDNNWNIVWKVNDQVVPGNLTTLNYTFPLTSTSYTVSYTATKADQTRQANINITTPAARAPANITEGTQISVREYELAVDLTNTGITDDWSLQWSSDPNATFTAADQTSTNVSFDNYNTNYNVTFTATPPQGSTANPVSITKAITTGAAIQPTISYQNTANPLQLNYTANISQTDIDGSWTQKWYIDNVEVPGATGDAATLDFALAGTNYNVKYVATKDDQTRQVTSSVTTPNATAPTDITEGSAIDARNFNLSVDLTNTGITNDWSLQWSSNPSDSSFSPENQDTTVATLNSYNTDYAVTLTANPPAGSGANPVSVTQIITTGNATQPTLGYTNTASPLEYNYTADLTNTDVDASWTQKWYINDVEVPSVTGNTATLEFPYTGTVYNVKYEATKDGQTRQVTEQLVTQNATTPQINVSDASSDEDLIHTVTADLSNTGITNDWTLTWSSDPTASFNDATANSTDVTFGNYDSTYTITLTATPPNGSTDTTKVSTHTIATGSQPIIYPTSAIYSVPPETGATASDIVNAFQSFGLPVGIDAVEVKSEEQFEWRCSPGYGMTEEASTLSVGGFSNTNKSVEGKIPIRINTNINTRYPEYSYQTRASTSYVVSNAKVSGGVSYSWQIGCFAIN
ncbi:hypothetical protein [Francisella uliginis]|uniref:Uncharacterized protein n=1 Tax=Francisella uliginis TaxID=573570 RepID=A0A1L4BTD7_9GAMM|nr:hypothetical protein [Francisella uliginis]API87116.1 hypothetical protein F7310_06990 [Francisella uliginis]